MATTYAAEIAADYRESLEYHQHPAILCRLCGDRVDPDEILADRVCHGCAESVGLVCCDNCGALLPTEQTTAVNEIGESGRLMRWRYCAVCVVEAA